jgi:hypothetical protein
MHRVEKKGSTIEDLRLTATNFAVEKRAKKLKIPNLELC